MRDNSAVFSHVLHSVEPRLTQPRGRTALEGENSISAPSFQVVHRLPLWR